MSNTQLPENIEEIKKFAKKIDIDVKYLLGEKYEGDLSLWSDSVVSLPDNIKFNVGGLVLYSVESLPDNIVFNIGGYLSLYSVESLPDNIVFNVGGCLWLSSVESLPANIVFNIGGYLDLISVRSLQNDIIFNVGGKIFFPTKHKVKVIWEN